MIKHGSISEGELGYLNTNPITRYCEAIFAERCEDNDLAQMVSGKRYGIDNMLTVAQWMIQNSNEKDEYCFSMLVCFLGNVFLYMDPYYRTIKHSYELLSVEDFLTGYTDLLDLILPHCSKRRLNSLILQQLPPLLYIISKISDPPERSRYTCVEGYIIPAESADALCTLLRQLLEAGCLPQVEMETRHGSPRMMGGFDMLMQVLETMQEYQRNSQDLLPLTAITRLLLEYGARTVVFRKLLYGASHSEAPWCYTTPSHSFLFQFLQFGANNLKYVSSEYEELFYILCNQADGYVLQFVLNTVHSHFTETHPAAAAASQPLDDTTGGSSGVSSSVGSSGTLACDCGECAPMRTLLQVLLHKCRSLKQLCRATVLKSVPNYTPRALNTLPLPPALKTYLTDFSQ